MVDEVVVPSWLPTGDAASFVTSEVAVVLDSVYDFECEGSENPVVCNDDDVVPRRVCVDGIIVLSVHVLEWFGIDAVCFVDASVNRGCLVAKPVVCER